MSILQTISALALVFGLLGALYWLSSRYSGRLGGVSSRKIKIVEKLPLGDRRSLLLVEIGQQSYLVGSTAHNISMIAPLEAEAEVLDSETSEEKSPAENGVSFKRVLEMIR